MYARLISFSGADADKRERAIQTLHETVIPTLRRYDGFAGYIALYDGENRRAKAVCSGRPRKPRRRLSQSSRCAAPRS